MAKKTIDFSVVREIALALADVKKSKIHGVPSLKLRGKLLTCPALDKSVEPNTLAVRIDFDQRAELLAAQPSLYYVTDHYVNYPTVLVRLSRIDPKSLSDLLSMAWRFVVSSKTLSLTNQ
jgi:hypothetical protein